ncbi:hypothetical protein [Megamonas funiformis]|jgi:predicted RNA-binding Zn-ribbon protein involved in translation (DUF1610 family)|uniref:hypothetical protein n=1 Tax=Megamonas funiformis TaxID=437897 RepID=UPI0022E40059|nr:hypothetical protein [Megamonas funiformis]
MSKSFVCPYCKKIGGFKFEQLMKVKQQIYFNRFGMAVDENLDTLKEYNGKFYCLNCGRNITAKIDKYRRENKC